MAIEHLRTAMAGFQLGIDLRVSFNRTQALLDQRAQQARARQVSEEAAKALKQIDAPLAAHREKMKLYQHETALQRIPRNEKLEAEMKAEDYMLRTAQAENRVNFAMNTLFSNQDNPYVVEAMQVQLQNEMSVYESLCKEAEMQEMATQAELDRKGRLANIEAGAEAEKEVRTHSANEQLRVMGREDALVRGRMDMRFGHEEKLAGLRGDGKGGAAAGGKNFLKALEDAELGAEAAFESQYGPEGEESGINNPRFLKEAQDAFGPDADPIAARKS